MVIKSRRLTRAQVPSAAVPRKTQKNTVRSPLTQETIRAPTAVYQGRRSTRKSVPETIGTDDPSPLPLENIAPPSLPDHRLPVYKDLVNEGLRHMSFRRAIRDGDGPTCGTMFIAQTPIYKKFGCKNYVKLSMYRALVKLGINTIL